MIGVDAMYRLKFFIWFKIFQKTYQSFVDKRLLLDWS